MSIKFCHFLCRIGHWQILCVCVADIGVTALESSGSLWPQVQHSKRRDILRFAAVWNNCWGLVAIELIELAILTLRFGKHHPSQLSASFDSFWSVAVRGAPFRLDHRPSLAPPSTLLRMTMGGRTVEPSFQSSTCPSFGQPTCTWEKSQWWKWFRCLRVQMLSSTLLQYVATNGQVTPGDFADVEMLGLELPKERLRRAFVAGQMVNT